MILLIFLVAGIFIGFARRGDFTGLVRLRGIWLILISVLAERAIVYLPSFIPNLFPSWLPEFQLARYLPLVLFALLNVRDWRMVVAGVGILFNFSVIAANQWRMPVSVDALAVQAQTVNRPEYFIMTSSAGANLWFFADIIHPFGMLYFSLGDVLLGAGVMLAIQHNMTQCKRGKHERKGKRQPAIVEEPMTATEPLPEPPAPAVTAAPQPAAPEASRVQPAVPEPVRVQPAPAPEPMRARPALQEPARAAFAAPPAPREKPEKDLTFLQTAPVEQYQPQGGDGEARLGNLVKLSPRLEAIARMAERGECVADVGCDHGKLSAWLALSGVPRVVAMDVSAQSLNKTKLLIERLVLGQAVQTRVSDGLKKLRPGEADIIVMAGMGGPTMVEILEAGLEKALAADKLILQPMNAVGTVRKWLTDNGFRISDERLAEEDSRIYQILAAMPGDDPFPPMSLFDLEVGRLLVDCRHPLLGKLLEGKIETIDTILSEIADNATPKAEARRSELTALRARCTEVLEWLTAG